MKSELNLLKKLPAFLRRYRYPALILLIGVGLMLWPSRTQRTSEPKQTNPVESAEKTENETDERKRMEAELAKILSEIDGAGQVRVMLTLRSTRTTQYQVNEDSQTLNDGTKISASKRTETVMMSEGSSYNEPVVVRQIYPAYQGALIVSQGGDNPAVRYQLANAVSALLGIGTDQITVVKMK